MAAIYQVDRGNGWTLSANVSRTADVTEGARDELRFQLRGTDSKIPRTTAIDAASAEVLLLMRELAQSPSSPGQRGSSVCAMRLRRSCARAWCALQLCAVSTP